MSHYFRRRRTKRNSFLEKKKLLKNLHINIVRQSFETLTKFMIQKRFLDFSDSFYINHIHILIYRSLRTLAKCSDTKAIFRFWGSFFERV